MQIDWNSNRIMRLVSAAVGEVAKEGAEMIAEDAKRNLERKAPDSTGTLASQIDVRMSKYEDGGYTVWAQGSGNYDVIQRAKPVLRGKKGKTSWYVHTRNRYYASFVELGTKKMAPVPYMRPALKRNKRQILKMYEGALDRIAHE